MVDDEEEVEAQVNTTTSKGIFQFLAGVLFVFVISILIFCMVICIYIVLNIGGIQECQR